MTTTRLVLDSQGFLDRLASIHEQFEEHAVGLPSYRAHGGVTAEERAGADPRDDPDRILRMTPEFLADLTDVFATSSWLQTLLAGAQGHDGVLMGHCRDFLDHAEYAVREHGLGPWLLDTLLAALDAVEHGAIAERTPVCLNASGLRAASRHVRQHGRKRFGNRRQQMTVAAEYANETHRFAAHMLLRWGAPEPTAMRIAYRIMMTPSAGVAMLDSALDPHAARPGADAITDLLDALRVQADAEYVQRHACGEIDVRCEPAARSATEREIDARFLYDAERLVGAYRALWDRTTPRVAYAFASPTRMEELRRTPVWENVAYLYDLAGTLFGAPMRHQLVEAFERRDRATFASTAKSLDAFCRAVRDMGVLVLPAALLAGRMVDRTEDRRFDAVDVIVRHAMQRDAAVELAMARVPNAVPGLVRAAATDLIVGDVDGYLERVSPLCARPLEDLETLAREGFGGMRWVIA